MDIGDALQPSLMPCTRSSNQLATMRAVDSQSFAMSREGDKPWRNS